MRLPFLDRERELGRVRAALGRREGALVCIYGRRRLGKSRLVQEALRGRKGVYYVADERDGALQRASLAREVGELIEGFGDVRYPDWEALLRRWWREAPGGAVLSLDEFPYLVSASPELPSLLQKLVDRADGPARSLVLCGSSQRMMQGLVLDASAPLYGRARETIRLGPLGLSSLATAFRLRSAVKAVEHHAVWGGVPRYWELALNYPDRRSAVEGLVLDPLGVLHREPERLLLDDLREKARASSILALVGQGCGRVSEIGGRLGIPSTSLARPLARLVDLGLLAREVPFDRSTRDTKRTYYRVGDPFLRFWFRFVEPNRSRLAAGQMARTAAQVEREWPQFLGEVWERIAIDSVPRLEIAGQTWLPASRWWGGGSDGNPLEIDIMARGADRPDRILVGEAKVSCSASRARTLLADLEVKAARCPVLKGKRASFALWVLRPKGAPRDPRIITAKAVVAAD